MAAQQPTRVVRFGPYEANLQGGELRKHGRPLRLPAQAIEVLALLLEQPGQIVTREQLSAKLWPNGTIVEFDHGINSCIRRLRAALNDSAVEPRYIETVPKRGYRFVHPCEIHGATAVSGQYRIVGPLGAGAMGVVYRATDIVLGRDVALKFPAEELGRNESLLEAFRREGRAAAALNHPNICTVYGTGEQEGRPFIAMELLEGETLASILARRKLTIDEVLAIARQVAAALDAAHAKGIVHRDIKPANIFVLAGNLVKVVDFGISSNALQLTGDGSDDDPACAAVGGTPRYMAPEQAGGRVAPQSDIFAFGVVVHEMIAGIPYETGKELSRLRPGLPTELAALAADCVARAPEARPQTAQELLVRLNAGTSSETSVSGSPKGLSRGAVAAGAVLFALATAFLYLRDFGSAALDSIAVIPFDNPHLDLEYVSDGLTEALINQLAAVPGLKVIARATVFRFKGQGAQPQSVGHKLGVKAVLTGRVSRIGDKLLVQADLVEVGGGSQIWGQKFERRIAELQSMQNDIAREIASRLRLQLGREGQARLRALYTADEEAYDLYLKALHAAPLRVPAASMKDLLKRSDYLQQALARDPGFALAHIAVAETQWAFGAGVYLPARTAFEKEKEAALRALELDESLGAAYMHVALAVWNLSWDYRSADKNFRRAIELGAQLAHGRYALFLIQNGRTAEAVTQARSALELDPASEYTLSVVSAVNAFAGDLERALEQARRASELAGMPTFFVPFVLVRKGRYDQALIEFNKMGPYPAVRGHAAYALARLGRTDEARRTLRELEVMAGLEGTGAYEIAFIHGALGEKDEAFRWLDKAYEQRDPGLTYIKIDHTLDPLRSDPRFRELQRRMGLSP